jgi:Rrf2 family transcriptional regulator, nitric oxide-sensitive transcriptional repressor
VISQTAEYALRAITHLAYNYEAPQSTREISAATKVPVPYLSKVLQGLSHAGLISSHRGIRGGFMLALPADTLSIWQVVEAVDPIRRIRTCPLGLASHGMNLCPLHRRLDDALALVERAFKESTVADVISERSSSQPLCPIRREESH